MPFVILIKHTEKNSWINFLPIGTVFEVEKYSNGEDFAASLDKNPVFRTILKNIDEKNGKVLFNIPLNCAKQYTVIDMITARACRK